MLGVEKKYPRPADFIKRVVIPAKEELDAVAPYSFDYKPILESKTGRGKAGIVGITFIPYFQPKNRDIDLEKKQDFNTLKRRYPGLFLSLYQWRII
jgi:Initiator Replication protein.